MKTWGGPDRQYAHLFCSLDPTCPEQCLELTQYVLAAWVNEVMMISVCVCVCVCVYPHIQSAFTERGPCLVVVSLPSRVWLCDPMNCSPPGSSVHGFSRPEDWSGLSFPSSGDPADPGIQPGLLHSRQTFTAKPPRKSVGYVWAQMKSLLFGNL